MMKISACYMVKNEYKNIARSIERVRPAADEIIVVDTGSTDGTRELAAECGARVLDFAWCDDFSAPRNYAIEQATGDWIIFLDADEYFIHPERVRGAIEQIVAANSTIDGIFIKLINIDAATGKAQGIIKNLRIIRRADYLRYRGIIHEQLTNISPGGGRIKFVVAGAELDAYHTGYSAALNDAKNERNLALLLAEAEGCGHTAKHDYYLAETYFGLGEYELAIKYAIAALQSDFTVVGGRGKVYHYIIESMRQLQMPLDGMLEVAKRAIAEQPESPEFYGEAGMVLLGMEKYADARAAFTVALEKYRAGNYMQSYFSPEIAARIADKIARIDALLAEQARERLKISACYIVKNERENLVRSIGSLRGSVNEIIVVDTGSNDGTAGLARELGASVYSYAWRDDFAAARNYAIGHAQGDWVVFLDADEYFTPDTAENLRTVIAESAAETDALLINIDNIDMATGELQLAFPALRIFRRLPGLAYRGRIHEALALADRELRLTRIPRTRLNIIHTGYSANLTRQKGERNLALLQAELAEATAPERLYMYLAETYDGLGEQVLARYYAYLDIASGTRAAGYASRSHRILLRMLIGPQDKIERLRVAEQAVAAFSALPDFYAEFAEARASVYDYEEAAQLARMAMEKVTDYQGLEPSQLTAENLTQIATRADKFGELASVAKKIKISACVIVKNEAANIGAWAENAKKYADELIVVDTGSSDNTVALACGLGCQVYTMEWQGFAAARNAALARATGDFATVLDADETFYRPAAVRGLLAYLVAVGAECDAILAPISNVDTDDYNRELIRAPHIRIVRLGRGLQYIWPVHEQLRRADGSDPMLYAADEALLIRHTGYASHIITAKAERNLTLMLAGIEQNGLQPGQSRFLAETYYALGGYEQARIYAERSLTDSAHSAGAESSCYRLLLDILRALREPLAARLALYARARELFPALPDFPALLGLELWEAGDAGAEAQLLTSLELYRAGQGGEASTMRSFVDEVYAALADIYLTAGDAERAAAYTAEALRINVHNAVALNIFAELNAGSDTANKLMEIVGSDEQSLRFLARFADSFGLVELFLNFAALLSDKFSVTLPETEFYRSLAQLTVSDLDAKIAQNDASLARVIAVLAAKKSINARTLREKAEQWHASGRN